MAIGTVKFYNPDKGFGFIVPDGGGADIFFHATELQKADISPIDQGDRLSYELEPGRNGRMAAGQLRVA